MFLLGMVLFAVLILFGAEPAQAYLDPGSGSMLIQSVMAIVLVAAAFIGTMRERIKSFLLKLIGRNPHDKEQEKNIDS